MAFCDRQASIAYLKTYYKPILHDARDAAKPRRQLLSSSPRCRTKASIYVLNRLLGRVDSSFVSLTTLMLPSHLHLHRAIKFQRSCSGKYDYIACTFDVLFDYFSLG